MSHLLKIKLCVGIAILTLVVGCNLPSSEPTTVTFLNNSFSVLMPGSWSEMTDLNDDADLQMGNYVKEAYAVFLSESKADFDAGMTKDEHSKLTRSIIQESLVNYQESAPENITIGDISAVRYRVSGSVDKVKIVYWHVTIDTPGHFHQLLLWSLTSKFASNEADFNSVIQSFKVLK